MNKRLSPRQTFTAAGQLVRTQQALDDIEIRRERRPRFSCGSPVNPIKTTSFNAVAGNLYRVAPRNATVTAFLPRLTVNDIGQCVHICRVDTSGSLFVNTIDGSQVNGTAVGVTISAAKRIVAFCYVDLNVWETMGLT